MKSSKDEFLDFFLKKCITLNETEKRSPIKLIKYSDF